LPTSNVITLFIKTDLQDREQIHTEKFLIYLLKLQISENEHLKSQQIM